MNRPLDNVEISIEYSSSHDRPVSKRRGKNIPHSGDASRQSASGQLLDGVYQGTAESM